MKKFFNKTVSLLMALVVLLTVIPMSGAPVSAATIVETGRCDTDIAYRLDSDGVLTLYKTTSGSSYSDLSGDNRIKKVVIENGVTNLSSSLFEGCKQLTSVTFADTVTSIGWATFRGCTSLTSVALPPNLQKLGGNSFYGCSNLSEVTLPDTITDFGVDVFNGSEFYSSIKWENSLKYIGKYLVAAKITLSGTCTVKEGTLVIAEEVFAGCRDLRKLYLPSSLVSICASALWLTDALGAIYYAGTYDQWKNILDPYNNNIGSTRLYCYCSDSHTYSSKITPPTCTQQGYTTYTCSKCWSKYNGDYVDNTGHTSDEWIYDVLPSIYESGKMHKECAVCSEVFEADTIAEKIIPDINGDGKINSLDALIVLNISVGKDVGLSDKAILKTDVNGDGKISSMDALIILNIVVGKIQIEN